MSMQESEDDEHDATRPSTVRPTIEVNSRFAGLWHIHNSYIGDTT